MKWMWFFLSFRGRISQKPYWIYMLSMVSGGFIFGVLSEFTESLDIEYVFGAYGVLMFWPTLGVHVKRWHDRGRSGWWFTIAAIIPIVTLWILVECAFFHSDAGSNRFGPDPEGSLRPVGEMDRFQAGLVAALICLAILITSFPRYRIPSGAMMPTLLVGDFIVANRIAYGIPMPFTNRQIMTLNSPSRGDVVVFRYPKDPSVIYIKRVVGIPGDRFEYYDKTVYINGKPAKQTPVGTYVGKGSGSPMSGADERIEMLDDMQHKILVMPETPGIEGEYLIQDGEYFVMGDNRDNSNDSRYWGAVPEANLVGKASRIWMNWDSAAGGIEWGRLGMRFQ